MIVLDTNIWLWAVQGSPRLPDACRDALETETDRVFISAISIWEVGMYARRKQGIRGQAIQHWIEDALSIFELSVFELTPRVVCESMNLPDLDHKDPADRLIIATARVLQCPLLTSDRTILNYPNIETIG